MTDFNQKTHDTDVGSHGRKSRQMMEVFENQEFGSIRVLQEAGKTFFCASDVAKALGYVNPYAAVKRHCRGPLTKREGVVQKVNQYGDAGEQVVEISFITEGDVYRLIVHSKLPSAERFEHWVFDEVLPSIRKHGVYMSDSILDQVIQHPEVIYTLAQELVAEREQLEGIRKQLDAAQPKADYILIDCMPSLGMMTVNALVAADSVIIPSQPNFLSTKGLNLLLRSISKIKRQINPRLKIDGILLTMVDNRTNNAKAIISSLRSTVGENIRVFRSEIPFSVRAAECSLSGESIFSHDRNGKVAAAYEDLTKEVTELEERAKNRSGPDRVR